MLCIRMDGNQTTIINPDDGKEKKFTFDFSYWSHDGATERPDGYNECAGPGKGTDGATYADQGAVFNDLGKGVLNNAYEGFNSFVSIHIFLCPVLFLIAIVTHGSLSSPIPFSPWNVASIPIP